MHDPLRQSTHNQEKCLYTLDESAHTSKLSVQTTTGVFVNQKTVALQQIVCVDITRGNSKVQTVWY